MHGDLFRIANDRDVRIVGHHDDLAPVLNRSDHGDKQMEDCLIVQILLGLVDDDRRVALINEQIEHQQKRSPFAWGELRQIL